MYQSSVGSHLEMLNNAHAFCLVRPTSCCELSGVHAVADPAANVQNLFEQLSNVHASPDPAANLKVVVE